VARSSQKKETQKKPIQFGKKIIFMSSERKLPDKPPKLLKAMSTENFMLIKEVLKKERQAGFTPHQASDKLQVHITASRNELESVLSTLES